MLFTEQDSLDEIFEIVKKELCLEAMNPSNTFHFVTLATQSDLGAEARYLVLREVDENLNFYLFTDLRSPKVNQLSANPESLLLFYHPTKRNQIRIKGKAKLLKDENRVALFWSKVPHDSRKAYNQILKPGTPIQHPVEAYHWNEPPNSANFGVIHFEPTQIETLQLRRFEHLRVVFDLGQNGWISTWIAP